MPPRQATSVRYEMVLNRFPEVIAQVNARSEGITEKVKMKIKNSAKARVRVLTGETRDSIKITKDGVEAAGAAPFLEYGTYKMPAYPFLGPAAEDAKRGFNELYAGLFAGVR